MSGKAEIIGLIVKALVLEAMSKPDEKIYVGPKVYTYREFAALLNGRGKLGKAERRFVEKLLEESYRLFRENEAFKEKILRLVGEG